MEIADEYQRLVFFVNKSRNLFRDLNESSKTKTVSIENIVIQFAEQELSKYSDSTAKYSSNNISNIRDSVSRDVIAGGTIIDVSKNQSKNIILTLDENKDESMLDFNDDVNIINKINKLIKDEVNIYSSIPKTLSKKSFSRHSTKIMKTKTKQTMKTNKTTKRAK
jgi:hypothetical protein